MNLVIVESPNKCKKIQSILGSNYIVKASVGHVADLPLKSIGVQSPDYEPEFILTERGKKTVSGLKQIAKKCDDVYLATDPDREGEAISFHLAHFLKLKQPKRVVFNEITDKAIKKAMQNPSDINEPLYQAQKARRVIDRLVGYKVSPKLSEIAQERLSAGRVQSVALRIIVDREQEITNFKVTNHYGVKVKVHSSSIDWELNWDTKEYITADNPYILDKAVAEAVHKTSKIKIIDIEQKEVFKKPPAPFITTTLQKAANLCLNLNSAETMQAAQKLFEKGAITYHRTDYPNLSDECLNGLRQELTNMGLSDYIAKEKNNFKSKQGAQEAHEAIRPTDFSKLTVDSDKNIQALYELIRLRALTSQMSAAKIASTKIIAKANVEVQGKSPIFIATGKQTLYEGWMKLTAKDEAEEKSNDNKDNKLPNVALEEVLDVNDATILNLKTKPPARYTEPSLIAKLERSGVGRPATYASIISNIKNRGYLELKGKNFLPTKSAETIVKNLKSKFKFMDLDYTKNMESSLDQIAANKMLYLDVVTQADKDLVNNLKSLSDSIPSFACPRCSSTLGGNLRRIKGKNGFFWGCSKYKEGCKFTANDNQGKPETK